jgi:endonuclease/exonuclease/phosphatase family metal-dependent hydrolase
LKASGWGLHEQRDAACRGVLLAVLLSVAPVTSLRAADPTPVTLRVMSFNIWLGGDQVNFQKTIEAVQASGADIVCLQEAGGNTARIAAALGWSCALPSRHMIARVPLFAAPAALQGMDGNDLAIAYAEIEPGRFVAIANVHLPSDPYGTNALRDGKSAAEVVEIERTQRLSAIEPYIAPLSALAKAGTPVVLSGDFNSPSPLDWPAMAKRFPQVEAPIVWPAQQALLDAGFTDTYRAAHPDPIATVGITWSYGYPYPHLDADTQRDRIDFVMALGAVKTIRSEILGDPRMPDTDIGISPWPSDHRAVVSTLEVVPGPAPAMVSIDRRSIPAGSVLTARFHAETEDGRLEGGRLVIIEAGAATDAAPLVSRVSNNTTDRAGSADFGTAGLVPGAYAVALRDAADQELARAPFWLVARDGTAELRLDKPSYAPGETMTATWANAPGNRYDWLGIFQKDEPSDDNYLYFFYVNGTVAGALDITRDLVGADLDPGTYELRLELDDGYARLAAVPFEVR